MSENSNAPFSGPARMVTAGRGIWLIAIETQSPRTSKGERTHVARARLGVVRAADALLRGATMVVA